MLVDTNIIVYSLTNGSPKQSVAQEFLTDNHTAIFTAHQSINETLRVLTHAKSPNRISPLLALTAIESITSQFQIISPLPVAMSISLELIRKYKITSNQIFDAYLVATALSHNIDTIATDNLKHLGKYKEIKVFNPFG